jgi:hypothetical protein
MKSIKQFLRVIAMICVVLFLLELLLSMFSPFGGYDLLVGRLITGFWFFFRDNVPAISWDAGTWGPGLGAFLLALAFAHHFFKSLAARTNRYWSFASSFCLVLAIPVLFVIAFIVPGVLLQWEILRHVPWIDVR